MTTPIEEIEAALAELRRDVDALKADAAARADERQRVKDWLRSLPHSRGDDPQPRDETHNG